LVEINLTSNDVILGVSGAQHPFDMYRHYSVPLALSTDDEGVSRIDLTHEYQRAVETYDVTYFELKVFSRNALEYSFLNESDKAALLSTLEQRFAEFEASFE
jgi:adenosine deaminase